MIRINLIMAAVLAALSMASSAGADERGAVPAKPNSANALPTIRPGQEGQYPVFVTPPLKPATQIVGTLHGRQIRAIESPAHISGMGKYMAVGPEGDIWYVESREDKAVRVDPKTLDIVQYYLPKGAAPYSIAIDSKGTAWMTAHGIEMLLEMHPDKGVVIAHQPPSHGFLIHINIASDDTVWFTQPGNNQIVSYKPGAGFAEYPPPTAQSGPGRLDFDSRGNVWYSELYTDKVAKLDIATGKTTEWDVPTKGGLPAGVRVDRANDDVIWVNEPMNDKLALFKDGKFTEYQIPTPGSVVSTNITDKEGNVWFTEGGWRGSAGGNRAGWLDPRTGQVEEFLLPFENSQPLGMVQGPDGSIWFSLVTGGHICQILPVGSNFARE
jgi:virginiamycin B lyase